MRREREREKILLSFLASCQLCPGALRAQARAPGGRVRAPLYGGAAASVSHPFMLLFFFPTLPVPSAFGVSRPGPLDHHPALAVGGAEISPSVV